MGSGLRRPGDTTTSDVHDLSLQTFLLLLTAAIATPVLGGIVVAAALMGVKDKPGGIYDKIPRWWSWVVLLAAGVRVRVHGWENASSGEPRIFAANHVSWFDVPALARTLPRYKFVAKAELFKVPVFGPGIRVAAEKIRSGNSVVVFPEGTRGYDYRLRPFKKGPFVLAVAAGVPIVPVILHGTIEVLKKGSFSVHPGIVDIHLLEPVSTAGIDYDQRDALMAMVRGRMADAMRALYGIEALPAAPARAPAGTEIVSSESEPTETR
jgi:1-acyl-sn-glycerol-3-phosphate acyltransferase